jgi:hypothetical protein
VAVHCYDTSKNDNISPMPSKRLQEKGVDRQTNNSDGQ